MPEIARGIPSGVATAVSSGGRLDGRRRAMLARGQRVVPQAATEIGRKVVNLAVDRF